MYRLCQQSCRILLKKIIRLYPDSLRTGESRGRRLLVAIKPKLKQGLRGGGNY